MSLSPSIVTAIATGHGIVFLAIGGIAAWRQLQGLRRQTGLSALTQMFEAFGSGVLHHNRLAIYQIADDLDPAEFGQEDYRTALDVMEALNRIKRAVM